MIVWSPANSRGALCRWAAAVASKSNDVRLQMHRSESALFLSSLLAVLRVCRANNTERKKTRGAAALPLSARGGAALEGVHQRR